jgi:hypothetical protein
MPLGPVDVYVVAFPGNKFSGEIVPAILELVESGVIRIIDLLFVSKDEDGVVTTLEVEDLGPEGAAFIGIDVESAGALNHEDADEIADQIPASSSALLIAYENVWMGPIIGAFARADAHIINHVRIPATVVNEVLGA